MFSFFPFAHRIKTCYGWRKDFFSVGTVMFSPFQCLTLQGMLSEGSVSTVFDTDSVRKPLHVKGEEFLQFGCSQVSSDEPGDESITQSRHFIDLFIYSTTQYLLDTYHLIATRKLIISANSHINFMRLISHFADGKTEQQGHKVIFWIFELDIDKSSRLKTGVAK